jgi:beta-lactamase regulating signal transducer with metallopeptidase domain
MVAAPIGTWVSQSPGEGRSVAARFIANISLSSSALIESAVAEGQAQLSGERTARSERGTQSLEFVRNSVASLWIPVRQRIMPWLPQIVVLWCGGVLAAAFRPLLSWSKVQQLRTRGVSPVPDAVHGLAARVAERLQLARAVAVRQSTLASSPVVVGYFRPVVLLPPCVVTTLTSTQLELILAHELSHARRHDYLVNLLQTLVETLFFYHPAVWWLSRQVRIERENCCDDAAMEMAANRAEYGRALLAIEEYLGTATALSIAAHGGSLLARIRRIAGCESSSRFAPWGGTFSFIAILTFAAVAWAAIAGQPRLEDSALPVAAFKIDRVLSQRRPSSTVSEVQERLPNLVKVSRPDDETQKIAAEALRTQVAPSSRVAYFASILNDPQYRFRRWSLEILEAAVVDGTARIKVRAIPIVTSRFAAITSINGCLDETYELTKGNLTLLKTEPRVDPKMTRVFDFDGD